MHKATVEWPRRWQACKLFHARPWGRYHAALQHAAWESRLNVENCYKELGVTAASSDAEIKAAWRRLAAQWHPDRNASPGAVRKIQRINSALEAIRKARREATDRPRTMHHRVRVTIEDAAAGCFRDLHAERVEPCARCDATGVQTQTGGCTTCGGAGQVRQPLWFAWMSPLLAECDGCRGSGDVRHPCADCAGTGRSKASAYHARVTIPPGAREGTVIEVPAQPGPGDAQDKAIFRVQVELQPHEFFRLEEDGTVKCEVPVDGFAWIANRWVEVPTPVGLQQMRLRQGHLVYRLKGLGFPGSDCIVTVTPLFPDALTSKQEALIDRLLASHSGDTATPAGQRTAAWNAQLREWQARLAEAAQVSS